MRTAFHLAAAVAVLASLLAVTRRDAVHALLYLAVSLLAVAVVFFLLGAAFAAALEVLIYAGAIVVLFVFAVMLLGLAGETAGGRERLTPGAGIGPAALAGLLLAELLAVLARQPPAPAPTAVSAKEVGIALFGPYLLAVELASMLLLAALVGAWHLGRRHHG